MHYRMTPNQLRQHIENLKLDHLAIKASIEKWEFVLEQNKCPECDLRIMEDLGYLYEAEEQLTNVPKVVRTLEEYLAEDEVMNGWKGEDRIIEL